MSIINKVHPLLSENAPFSTLESTDQVVYKHHQCAHLPLILLTGTGFEDSFAGCCANYVVKHAQ